MEFQFGRLIFHPFSLTMQEHEQKRFLKECRLEFQFGRLIFHPFSRECTRINTNRNDFLKECRLEIQQFIGRLIFHAFSRECTLNKKMKQKRFLKECRFDIQFGRLIFHPKKIAKNQDPLQ